MFQGAIIRKALSGEVTAVYDLICLLKDKTMPLGAFERIYIKNLADPMISYFVAEVDGRIIGFISLHIQHLLHHSAPIAEVQELVIDESFRNLKIGVQLLNAVEKVSRNFQCELIEVSSNNKRIHAHRFYEKNGFVNTHMKLMMPLGESI